MKNDDIISALTKAFIALAPTLAERYAETATDVMRGATVEQLLALAGAEKRSRPRGAGGRTTKSATGARAKVSTETTANMVLEIIRRENGVSAESIRKELGLPRGPWRNASAALIASGQITRKGTRRSAKYFVAGGPATAATPNRTRARSKKTK